MDFLPFVLGQSIPALNLTVAITAIFDYVNQLLPTFAPIGAIGVAFSVVMGIVAWIGGALVSAFRKSGR